MNVRDIEAAAIVMTPQGSSPKEVSCQIVVRGGW